MRLLREEVAWLSLLPGSSSVWEHCIAAFDEDPGRFLCHIYMYIFIYRYTFGEIMIQWYNMPVIWY